MTDISNVIDSVINNVAVDMMALSLSEKRIIILNNLKNKKFNNIDLIYSHANTDCCTAIRSGWAYGFRSNSLPCLYISVRKKHYPLFIDNLFEKYNHTQHLNTIKKYKPKYCTVRDMMTKVQCAEVGIKYYSPKKILEWAYELKQYAQNVLVIPKHEKYLNMINPNDFMIGYSVPTSYGGTPIPITEFSDYKIHLLGGAINDQIALCSQMSDNIVSLDNNYINLLSDKGIIWLSDGSMVSLKSLNVKVRGVINETSFISLTNVQKVAMAINLGSVASYFGVKHNE